MAPLTIRFRLDFSDPQLNLLGAQSGTGNDVVSGYQLALGVLNLRPPHLSIRITPATNPPMWANHATPLPTPPEAAVAFKSCIRNQIPRTIKAGIRIVFMKKKKKTKTRTLAEGKLTK